MNTIRFFSMSIKTLPYVGMQSPHKKITILFKEFNFLKNAFLNHIKFKKTKNISFSARGIVKLRFLYILYIVSLLRFLRSFSFLTRNNCPIIQQNKTASTGNNSVYKLTQIGTKCIFFFVLFHAVLSFIFVHSLVLCLCVSRHAISNPVTN